MMQQDQTGQSLIGLLIALMIVLVVAALSLRSSPSPPLLSAGETAALGGDTLSVPAVSRPEEAINTARGAQAALRRHRVEQATEQFRIREGRDPLSESELVSAGLLDAGDTVTE